MPEYYPTIDAPAKRRSTLLDVAQVDTTAGAFEHKDGADLFDSYNCLKFDATTNNFCSATDAKDLDQAAGWIDGFRFAAYGGATCRTIGLDMARQESEVRAAFDRGESAAVERALLSVGLVASDGSVDGIPGIWDEAVDITDTDAVPVRVGLALLEEYAASVYSGAPTLHLPISPASFLASHAAIAFEGDVLVTKLGSRIAAGAGYGLPSTGPDSTEADDGEHWIYATGTVYLAPAPNVEFRQVVDTPNNNVISLVERGYLAAIDCFRAAIRVTLV